MLPVSKHLISVLNYTLSQILPSISRFHGLPNIPLFHIFLHLQESLMSHAVLTVAKRLDEELFIMPPVYHINSSN